MKIKNGENGYEHSTAELLPRLSIQLLQYLVLFKYTILPILFPLESPQYFFESMRLYTVIYYMFVSINVCAN